MRAGEELCGKGLGFGPGGQTAQSERAVCCCSCTKESQQDALLHQEGHHQQRWRSHCPSLISTCQAAPGILRSVLVPMMQKGVHRLGRVQRKATKMIKGLDRLTHEGRLREKQMSSALGKRLKETSSPCSSISGKMDIPICKKSYGKGTNYSQEDSNWTKAGSFSQGEQTALGIIFHWKVMHSPQYQPLLRFSWKGCWAVLSRPCFTKNRLIFYYSI